VAYALAKGSSAANKNEIHNRVGIFVAHHGCKGEGTFHDFHPDHGANRRLCVIDPSQATRDRWRELLPNAQYWEYDDIKAFKSATPAWWWND